MPDARRSRHERGYDTAHDHERRRWARVVASGAAQCANPLCLRPTRLIHPSEPWDLGHTADRSRYRGPEHRECNRAEGGRKGSATANTRDGMSIRKWGER